MTAMGIQVGVRQGRSESKISFRDTKVFSSSNIMNPDINLDKLLDQFTIRELEFEEWLEDLSRIKIDYHKNKERAIAKALEKEFNRILENVNEEIGWFSKNGFLETIEETHPNVEAILNLSYKGVELSKKDQFIELLLKFLGNDNADPNEVLKKLWDRKRWSNPSHYLILALRHYKVLEYVNSKEELMALPRFSQLPLKSRVRG